VLQAPIATRGAHRPPPGGPVNYIDWPRLMVIGLGHRLPGHRVALSRRPGDRAVGAFPVRLQRQVLLSHGQARRMAALFGPSSADLEHLRSAVRALGTTSVPGLAAALSWRERKTEKTLAHELGRPNTPLVYDPSRRTVRWGLVVSLPPPPAQTPATLPPSSPSVARAPPPMYTPTGLKTLCPNCHVALQSTGSAGLVVCPQCGRLSSARSGGAATAASVVPAAPATVSAPPVRSTTPASATTVTDRRSQELFAAWVTNQPIPCPKCRTPLRHRGVSEYSCPSCGQSVRFPTPADSTPTISVASR